MRKTKPSTKEYVYLLQEREFIRLEEATYKIGRTKDPDRRHKAYPKDSELLMLCQVPDCQSAEKQIKEAFSEKFTQRREYGVEYFNGNVELMMSLMSSIVYPVERPFGNLFRRKPLPQRPFKSTKSIEHGESSAKESVLVKLKKTFPPMKPLPQPPMEHICQKCGNVFNNTRRLNVHMKRMHPQTDKLVAEFVKHVIEPDSGGKASPDNRTLSLEALYQAYYRNVRSPNDFAFKLKIAILSDERLEKHAAHPKESCREINHVYTWNGIRVIKETVRSARGYTGIRLSEQGLSLIKESFNDQTYSVKDFLKHIVPDETNVNCPENRCVSLYSFYQREAFKLGLKPELTKQQFFTLAFRKAIADEVKFSNVVYTGPVLKHNMVYEWNETTQKLNKVKAKSALRGFNGLRVNLDIC